MKTIPFLASALMLPAALVCSCEKTRMKVQTLGDASFARETFQSLAKGDLAVSDSIDWKTLHALGQNVGVVYVTMASEEDQRRFREGFITQFAASFQAAGGKVEDFVDWKVVEHDATRTLVTAASPSKVLRITVNERDGREFVGFL
jgi:hypothetical protein